MKLTDAEWQIMNALWQGHPATAREIADRLPPTVKWAYTTIKTMLTRLKEKRAVRERKRNTTSVYDPLVSKRRAQRTALKDLVNQAFEGAFGPLMHFLVEGRNLTAKQRKELLDALSADAKKKGEQQ